MTTAVLLRSGMMGNYHVPFCRAVEGVTLSLTLILVKAIPYPIAVKKSETTCNGYKLNILILYLLQVIELTG